MIIIQLTLFLVTLIGTGALAQTTLAFETEKVYSYDGDTTLFLPESVEKSNPVKILIKGANKNVIENIQKYKGCMRRAGMQPNRLVSRNLNSDHYNHLNLQWNLRKEKVYPLAYFLPMTAQDVAKAVKCGLGNEIHLVPNSGGHSYEAIGWGNNETVVVDFRNMNKISVVGSGPHAIGRIEPGALIGEINAYFWENGGYALPMGTCLTVGIGGHAIGGGIGFFSSQYGLTIDNIEQYEMVDGRGQIIVANHETNSDLFWALRGVGAGYIGIVTSIKVKLLEAHKIKITNVKLSYRIKHFASTYIAFQNMLKWMKKNEPRAHLEFLFGSEKCRCKSINRPVPPGITILAFHIQDTNVQPKGSSAFVKALIKTFPKPSKIVKNFPNYIQIVYNYGYAPVVTLQGTTNEPTELSLVGSAAASENAHCNTSKNLSDAEIIIFLKSLRKYDALPRYFKEKSFFIKKYFTLAQMKRVAHILHKIPQNNIWIQCTSQGKGIQRIGRNKTAFVHRDAILQFLIHYEGSAEPVQVYEGMTYLYELWNTIQFMDGGETYQNFPDLDVTDHLVRNYGQNLDRLIEQKHKSDPTNFFVSPLSLPNLHKTQKLRS